MIMSDAIFDRDGVRLYLGDCLRVLPGLESGSFDAVVTDPPYSSGGMMRGDRAGQKTSGKYVLHGTARKAPEFSGDNRDQRGMLAWSQLWLAECRRLVRPGGALLCFSDWRQLPLMTDAIQCGGWVWRGIVPWDKTEGTRPQRGWFRAQCEYVLTASNGSMGMECLREVGDCLPGCYRQNVMAGQKRHITGKPVALLEQLLRVVKPGGRVLDPFAGSGTTLLAARALGLEAVGVEETPENAAVAAEWLGE